MVRALPRDRILPYAVTAGGEESELRRVRSLFTDIRVIPMPWWNLDPEAGLSRRVAYTLGRWRKGMTFRSHQAAIVKAIEDWDIDMVHSGTALTLGGALAARAVGVPHIWHIKECIGRNNRVQFPMSDPELVSYISRLSVQVVVMSDYIGTFFREHGCQNLMVLPDGVILEPYMAQTSRNLRTELGLKPDTLLVGMVASLTSSWKRHDVFIRMAGLLAYHEPKVHFIIIGPQPSPAARWPYDLPLRYFSCLQHLASGCVPDGRLTFHNYVLDTPDIMRSLDILVHTCDIEPFGRIAIEAMAAGTPVVGPTTGGIAETVVHGCTGLLVSPGDPGAFADATRHLLADHHLRQRLGNTGRIHVQKYYTVARQVEQLASLYEKALGWEISKGNGSSQRGNPEALG
jgi:glycosyltransferase involved in cell wall biosynthesis